MDFNFFMAEAALAAPMGPSFRRQPPTGRHKRKAKVGAVVDTNSKTPRCATGANAIKLGPRSRMPSKVETTINHENHETASAPATFKAANWNNFQHSSGHHEHYNGAKFPPGIKERLDQVSDRELVALKRGVPNEHGQIAYFLPSFLEDPWAHLAADENGGAEELSSQQEEYSYPVINEEAKIDDEFNIGQKTKIDDESNIEEEPKTEDEFNI